MAHSKTLEFLKREEHLGGPRFELEKLWEEHTYYEFERRSVERTMAVRRAFPSLPTRRRADFPHHAFVEDHGRAHPSPHLRFNHC